MTTQQFSDPGQLTGLTVMGSDGAKLGKVEDVYLDVNSSKPEWAAVKSGMFGGHVSLVPLAQAKSDGQQLQVPYGKDQLKDAPHHDPGQELSPKDEEELYRHYGMTYAAQPPTNAPRTEVPTGQGRQDRTAQGHDTSGPNTDDAMTRSEEQLHVGTQARESGRARLRKHVVTEQQTHTVPVSHEEVRVTREPITEANRDAAMAGGDITEEEHEVTLHEERPVVSKETVPVERVRLSTETVTGEETITESVRKEHIEEQQAQRKQ